ncbi:hypothetical protein DAETH_48800 (plasmid) [Deinococcus aetherius]|uniref:Uncharacterized protein n=1 Tax=Deinococcus aetherius TaxID=200252 RepID=A0ABM8AMC3_9DEIO|nr:hypothetical protein DAETH_48800 [Deinococcus aetherius]
MAVDGGVHGAVDPSLGEHIHEAPCVRFTVAVTVRVAVQFTVQIRGEVTWLVKGWSAQQMVP